MAQYEERRANAQGHVSPAAHGATPPRAYGHDHQQARSRRDTSRLPDIAPSTSLGETERILIQWRGEDWASTTGRNAVPYEPTRRAAQRDDMRHHEATPQQAPRHQRTSSGPRHATGPRHASEPMPPHHGFEDRPHRHGSGTRKQEDRRVIWKVILVLWIAFIWVNSLIPGVVSSEESLLVVRFLKPILDVLGIQDLDLVHLLVRKAAHFSEYLILAVLATIALRPRIAVPLWPAVETCLLWAIVPSVDEFIQLHVPGRAGSPNDVLIDMAGFGFGLIIATRVRASRERAASEQESHPRGSHMRDGRH